MPANPKTVLALDYGDKRIGLAIASLDAKLPRALDTLSTTTPLETIKDITLKENVSQIVVGYPRGLNGQTTAQTSAVDEFIKRLAAAVNLPIDKQDESLTSRKAELELNSRGKAYTRADIDALSAIYILEDWLKDR